jgi:hypothetical protein
MADLPELEQYDAGVYQLETTDAVVGGAGGKANAGSINLANRTKWLKAQVDALLAASELWAPIDSPVFTGDPQAPTPAQFDDDTSLATTEWVQRNGLSYNGYLAYSSNKILTAANMGGAVGFAGGSPATFTLPDLSALSGAPGLCIVNVGTAILTVACAGADLMQCDAASIASIVLLPGDDITLMRTATKWVCTGGLARIKYSAAFAFGSGYQKMPDGKILQVGSITTSSSADVTFTFPTAFSSNPLVIGVFPQTTNPTFGNFNTPTTTNVKVSAWTSNTGARSAIGCQIFAYGI